MENLNDNTKASDSKIPTGLFGARSERPPDSTSEGDACQKEITNGIINNHKDLKEDGNKEQRESAKEQSIQTLWQPQGRYQVVVLENSYYIVKFEKEEDYTKVLTEGPWTVYGSYLTVQPWSRSFSTTEKHPSHVVVWIRLSGLPYRYYTKALFNKIASTIGIVVKVDYNTSKGERGRFARLAVTIDLNKPILPCIGIDGFVQKLDYEGLQLICYRFGVYGHTKETCGKANQHKDDNIRNNMNITETQNQNQTEQNFNDQAQIESYGP
ncbi:hypothetical protein F3Y22_tig00110377pilonHSYRG00004 [Hibiscus syriacus]|uniref:DUF4283 domain-containing protein n=1 Tax=Hibiscus syriacus TaxID=106335 RepID=A0A6A3AXZ6_HIBSY|nr:hypothetical protein F3Y22_tig00110377pilonHSYRG00004 [Hibiscus syriacus]